MQLHEEVTPQPAGPWQGRGLEATDLGLDATCSTVWPAAMCHSPGPRWLVFRQDRDAGYEAVAAIVKETSAFEFTPFK